VGYYTQARNKKRPRGDFQSFCFLRECGWAGRIPHVFPQAFAPAKGCLNSGSKLSAKIN